jgi:hypothetical protein
MSKIKRLRKRFTAFVNQLTPDQCREQLVLAYLQMEKCKNVLKGYKVEPVEMMDNGDSSDLELFYRCKKAAAELGYLNKMVHDGKKVGAIEFEVKVDTNLAILSLKDEEFRRVSDSIDPKVLQVGSVVYFLYKGRIHKSIVEDNFGIVISDCTPVCKVKGYDNPVLSSYLYSSDVRLARTIGESISNHASVSSDHESAYFIDQTSRVFKAAKWYLEEQKIEHFESLNAMREYLLKNIVDDTKIE